MRIWAISLHTLRSGYRIVLDKTALPWQYIVEVNTLWHNILCPGPEFGSLILNTKGKLRNDL